MTRSTSPSAGARPDSPDEVARQVHEELLDLASRCPTPDDDAVAAVVRRRAPLLSDAEVRSTVDLVRQRFDGLGPLQRLLDDPDVSEVMVNGGRDVWVERAGRLELVAHVDDVTTRHLIERIVSPLGLRIDRVRPMADARLPDGSRVNVVIPPLAIDGPCITIRRFASAPLGLDAFCTPDVAAVLEWAVRARQNLVVSGATAAGKTSLLNALAGLLPRDERIITVEDAAELRVPGRHVIRLEARPPNADGVGEVPIRDLVRNALRMRPDRIVVGEVRGAEAFDMVQALSTGHDGSLSTCHANGPADALRRLEALASMAGVGLPTDALREQIVGAVDLVVHVGRRPGGARTVLAVDEVVPFDGEVGPLSTRAVVAGGRVVGGPQRPPRAVDPPEQRT